VTVLRIGKKSIVIIIEKDAAGLKVGSDSRWLNAPEENFHYD